MDSGEAAIAAVFGSLTGFEAAPMLFEALLPWVTYPDAKSEKGRGKRASFAKLLRANLHAPSPRTSRTSLTRARGVLSPEMIRNAETDGPAEVEALLNAVKITASQVGVRPRKRVVSARQAAFGP